MSGQPPETESELVELLRSVDVRAPERLHSSVQALVAERSADGRGRRWRGLPGAPSWLGSRATAVAVGAAAAVALATAALLIVLGAGGAPRVRGGTIAWREGTPYRLLREDGARVVAWTREGHLCVISGRGVAAATLLKLASWNERALAA